MFDSVKNAYQSFSNSMDSFQRDMADIRDTFVGIKNVVGAIFNFMGQETAILLFCTFLFLFVVNLIPFLFIGKKARARVYGMGIGASVCQIVEADSQRAGFFTQRIDQAARVADQKAEARQKRNRGERRSESFACRIGWRKRTADIKICFNYIESR